MKKVFCKVFEVWLPLAIITIILSGLAYVLIQQNYRASANDPQIQIAGDVAEAINAGAATPDQIAPAQGSTDLAKSLATFVIIYGEDGKAIGSTAVLDGKTPEIPKSALDASKSKGINKITWQPKDGVREAMVISPFGGEKPGFIAVGRSLREIEIRIQQALWLSIIGCVGALILSLLVIFLFVRFKDTKIETLEIKETVEVTEQKE
jgi:hypothetical protein